MAVIKSELSKRNPYHISKYRFLELRNFCLQYLAWKAALRNADGYSCRSEILVVTNKDEILVDSSVERAVMTREELEKKIDLVEQVAELTDRDLSKWLIKGVTLPASYEYLSSRHGIPCSRDTYYKRYRKFFCILDKLRG